MLTKKQSCGRETRKSSSTVLQIEFSTVHRNVVFQREIEQLTQRTAELVPRRVRPVAILFSPGRLMSAQKSTEAWLSARGFVSNREGKHETMSLASCLKLYSKISSARMTLNKKLEADLANVPDALRASLSKEMNVDVKYQLLQVSLSKREPVATLFSLLRLTGYGLEIKRDFPPCRRPRIKSRRRK